MKSKIIPRDYKEELANVAEQKRFGQSAGNLLLSMLYKTEDSFDNYKTVKREVPDRDEFLQSIVDNVRKNCYNIEIAEPHSDLEKELKATKYNIISEKNKKGKTVISFPNEKNLLYGISKASLPEIDERLSTTEKAVITAISIGKCISISEVIRDFNGWSWSILPKEIESTECNIIYELLSYLYGYEFINNIDSKNLETLRKNMTGELWNELEKVSTQFYLSYDKNENEQVLKMLSTYKTKLSKMSDRETFIKETVAEKKAKLSEIGKIDEILSDPRELKKQYLAFNAKLPNESKIFSVSHYEDLLKQNRQAAINSLGMYNKLLVPEEFIRYREDLRYKIKFYETKTDISKFQKEFLKCFQKKVEITNNKKEILDLIYEIRYLNFIPNCRMKLSDLERKIIPKAIEARVLNPISNNDELDYKLLKGIFDSQTVSLEGLYIMLGVCSEGIKVTILDGDNIEREYVVRLPEGSNVEIRKTKKSRIFE